MVATRPPPSAEELDELSEAFRRDPGRAFIGLGDALLALGRPRDAVEIGARGLQDDPGNLDGRLMVARAFTALHQWKEAQAELLKVVKADRNHGPAFRMLGEVLMRRADYERALPVLQHAQNLNPADPSILGLLRRARAGQALDPPPPIPTPMAPPSLGPRAGGPRGRPSGPPVYSPDEPTRMAGGFERDPGVPQDEWVDESALARMKLERVELRRDGRRAPMDGQVRRSDARGYDEAALRPVEHHMPPPTEDVFAPLGQDPVRERMGARAPGPTPGGYSAASMPTAAMPAAGFPSGGGYPGGFSPGGMPPGGFAGGSPSAPAPGGGFGPGSFGPGGFGPGGFGPSPQPGGGHTSSAAGGAVRPRVVAGEKPRDAAQASLRQSAAVGEQYLNNLLVGGLLDIPRVRVPDAGYDLAPGRRWGRSTARIFAYLFVILFLTVGGGGAWFWYAERQRGEDVQRHIATARPQIDDGDYDGLRRAAAEARSAVQRDQTSALALALLAEASALETFLYGEIKPAEVQGAIELAGQQIKQPTQQGFRELVLARAAHTLTVLPLIEQGADQRLAEARAGLEKWLAANKNDRIARWLLGHALWAAGDRKGARAAFTEADQNGQGPAMAAIGLADMLLDEGEFEKARALYDRALKKSPHHPWAFIGRSLTRSERSTDIQEAMSDLNVGVPQSRGPRVEAWKQLAMATAYFTQQDFEGFAKALEKAVTIKEPRFLARVAHLRAQQGNLVEAAKARAEIRWYADKPQPEPLVIALDAELHLASGMAREAFAAVEKEGGLRAATLRGRALFDMGKFQEALAELDQALVTSPRDLALQVWAESARLIEASGDERRKVEDQLDSLGRQSKSKAERVPQAIALIRTGRSPLAREKLEVSLKDVSSEYPNAFAYRAHVELAILDREAGKPDQAAEHVARALELNPGYLPAHDLACQLLADTAAAKAKPHCAEVVKADASSIDAELAFVRSLTPNGPPRAADDRKSAAEALRRAKKKGANEKDLQDHIPRVDPALFAELGVTPPRGRR